MEVDHWLTSLKSATSKTTSSFSETLGVIGLLLSLVVNLVVIVVLLLTYFFKWVLGVSRKPKTDEVIVREPKLTFEELEKLHENTTPIDLYED
jgi:hypothetical protein